MGRQLKVAAVQMDATPAPLDERLSRAADLIAEAVSAGAKLVVLPELFNAGYEYDKRNYQLAEPINGQTVSWMKQQASQHSIHLAGTLMLVDENEIYNTALLVAPDGQIWRYDKQHPFLWERAYFKEGHGLTIADTEFGNLGMMICWDAAHADLWKQYAGKVDAMLVMSCPPKLSSADLVFPDGLRLNMRETGGMQNLFYTDEEHFPGKDMDAQAAWMGVPVVHTVGAGTFRSRLPLSLVSMGSYLMTRPDLWNRIPQASQVQIEAGFDHQTKVIDKNGEVLARVVRDGDGFTLAEIDLPDAPPMPRNGQPKMQTHPLIYMFADTIGAIFMPALYRSGTRERWGEHMAPVEESTKRTLMIVAVIVVVMLLWSLFSGGKKESKAQE